MSLPNKTQALKGDLLFWRLMGCGYQEIADFYGLSVSAVWKAKGVMKFRKKPVVIEAVQLRWDTWSEMCEHAGVGHLKDGKPEGCYVDDAGAALPEGQASNRIGLHIPTLEGLMLAVQDDWVIRGVKGELYACKPDIFALTYELAEAGQSGEKADG